MSYTGADSSLHRHSIPPQLERYLSTDFELGALEQKAMSGIVKGKDTIDTALQYGQPYGRHPSTASHPTLTNPLWSLRQSGPEIEVPKEGWKPAFENLVKLLPEETRSKLLREMGKPFGEREPGFIALQGLLETAAKFLTMIAFANKEIDPAGPQAAKREEYLGLPTIALKNLENLALNVLKRAEEALSSEP